MTVYEFISNNIDKTTKTYDENIQDGIGIPLIPLPYPFTTPCAEGMFQEMYYWDTYFTHKCLFLTKRGGQVFVERLLPLGNPPVFLSDYYRFVDESRRKRER